MKNNELKAEALNLFGQGMSYGKIAEQLGVGKTTVYSWITTNDNIPPQNVQNVQKPKKALPNELEELKEELKYNFGTDQDISVLVELRKAELEHQLKMETIELEREKLLQSRKNENDSEKEKLLVLELKEINAKLEAASQKSEQIQSAMNKIEKENEALHGLLQKKGAEKMKMELDTDLKNDCSDNIREYLAMEEYRPILGDVETVLENNEALINAVIKWCKANKQKKSSYPELFALKEIRKSLKEMIEDFGDDEDVDLEFVFKSDFTERLKNLL